MTAGTPKNLRDAIQNGIESQDTVLMSRDEAYDITESVKNHVRDFLSQHFGAAMMTADDAVGKELKKIFNSTVGEQQGEENDRPANAAAAD